MSLADFRVKCQKAAENAKNRDAYRRLARENLTQAPAKQKIHADRKRWDMAFKEADLFMLSTSTLRIARQADLPKNGERSFWGHWW